VIKIDDKNGLVTFTEDGQEKSVPLSSPKAFRVVSDAWLRAGWDTKYVYSFCWMGRPIIQLPEDIVRIQEVIWRVKPDLIIETGVAHGGSLIFYASLCRAIGKGKVVGIDIEIRPHNRAAIEAHPLFSEISLIEGSSVDADVVAKVRELVTPGMSVLVILDSNHSKAHVLAELEAYSPLVSVGSYIVATDGIMRQVVGGPRTLPDWAWNNPAEAAREFVSRNPNFKIEEPSFDFNEGSVDSFVTYWPDGYIKRLA
jgi:cephalosporin hydroxylase